jgi:hypothetical protein
VEKDLPRPESSPAAKTGAVTDFSDFSFLKPKALSTLFSRSLIGFAFLNINMMRNAGIMVIPLTMIPMYACSAVIVKYPSPKPPPVGSSGAIPYL